MNQASTQVILELVVAEEKRDIFYANGSIKIWPNWHVEPWRFLAYCL